MSQRLIPTAAEIVAHLDTRVIGQDDAKHVVARAMYRHSVAPACSSGGQADRFPLGRSHVLLIGATGCGKTLLVKEACRFSGLDFVYESCAGLVQSGYIGHPIDGPLARWVAMGGNRPGRRGVIFLDESDKIALCTSGSERDIAGRGVQQEMLPLTDGQEKSVRIGQDQQVVVDTSVLLFIFAGAFVGLEDIIRKRLYGARALGFHAGGRTELDDDALLARVAREDVEAFGFIPEFIGRIGSIATLRSLKKQDMVRILTSSEDNALARSQKLFAAHGVGLTFTPKAIEEVAERAARLGTGARGLDAVVLDSIAHAEDRLPDLEASGVTEVRIDERVIRGSAQPALIRRGGHPAQVSGCSSALRSAASALLGDAPPRSTSMGADISDTRGWTADQILERLALVKDRIGWRETTGSARKWWEAFEAENQHRLGLVLRLAEELAVRKATLTEFFLAYVYSNTDNIQANLCYLDYTRLKKEEEARRKRESAKTKVDPDETE
jgi:ATP-dependent Clp protease ATP-binding subunit ClpX